MTFAGFFVHLNSIPPVLRWLQWLCPLKYTLEALSVNEVGSGLMIQDTLQGVPVDVSASLIMNLVSHISTGYICIDGQTILSLSFLGSGQIITIEMFLCCLPILQDLGLASLASFGSRFVRDDSIDGGSWGWITISY
jgi:hypothetical protein